MHLRNYKFFCYIDKFDKNFLFKLPSDIAIIYRNYAVKNDLQSIINIKKICKIKKIKFYLSNNIKLAIKLDLDGVYLPSFNKTFNHNAYNFKTKFKILGSAHNLKEIRIKENQKVSQIFISPIFKIKKKNDYLGIYNFMKLYRLSKAKIVGLGGINNKNIKILDKFNLDGVAGISMFNYNKRIK